MNNKMKQKFSFDELQTIFDENFLGKITNIRQLNGGEFNSVYSVTTGLDKYVVKISPSTDIKVLTYEKNILYSEYFALNSFKNITAVQIPKVVAYGKFLSKYNYLVIDFLEGTMLSKIKLEPAAYDNIMFYLGKAMAEFHNVKFESGFGYLQTGLKNSWKTAYYDMLKNILEDAKRVNCKIPYINEITECINKCTFVFADVKKPAMFHFDLWQGNIFVKDNKLSAVIDFERTFFGDPLGDFIHLDYMLPFDFNTNKKLIEGYNSVADIKLMFSKNEMIRLYLMRIYLGLIACVEPYYRFSKFNPMFYFRKNFARRFMHVTLIELNKLLK